MENKKAATSSIPVTARITDVTTPRPSVTNDYNIAGRIVKALYDVYGQENDLSITATVEKRLENIG